MRPTIDRKTVVISTRCNTMRVVTVLTAASCLYSGCSKKEPAAYVHGKVTYKNKPVIKGSVVFLPKAGQIGYGNLLPDGSYKLLNQLKEEGIKPGQYTATISLELDRASLNQVEPPIPTKFAAKESSPLKYDVLVGDNEINMNLDDPSRPSSVNK